MKHQHSYSYVALGREATPGPLPAEILIISVSASFCQGLLDPEPGLRGAPVQEGVAPGFPDCSPVWRTGPLLVLVLASPLGLASQWTILGQLVRYSLAESGVSVPPGAHDLEHESICQLT